MSFSLIYLGQRFLFRIGMFIRDWYYGGFRAVAHTTFSLLASLDNTFALFVTLRAFGEPLYGDHTVIGHVLGLVFRTFRIAIALALYLAVVLIGVAAYLIWALVPFLILFSEYLFSQFP